MIDEYKAYVEQIIEEYLPQSDGAFSRLNEAMRYSVCLGGKRIRPILMKLAYEAVGATGNIDAYMCAIEFVHTYSLIHDDLPAMDNDDLRRGKPTNHIQFDEATAILAGDGLLTYAFEVMFADMTKEDVDPAKVIAGGILASAAGVNGMVAGQMLDIQSEGKDIDIETLDLIHLNKTGALLCAATKMGAVLGYGNSQEVAALEAYGMYIGKVFQIVDDILDETGEVEQLGKPINSDIENGKITYTRYYTSQECYEIATKLTDKAIKCLDRVDGDTEMLESIAKMLINRRK